MKQAYVWTARNVMKKRLYRGYDFPHKKAMPDSKVQIAKNILYLNIRTLSCLSV